MQRPQVKKLTSTNRRSCSIALLKRCTCDTFGINESNYTSKYLGTPLEWGQTKKKLFPFLILRTSYIIQSWRSKFLTLVGREIMVTAVLQALPLFVMYVFKLPTSINQQIEKYIR